MKLYETIPFKFIPEMCHHCASFHYFHISREMDSFPNVFIWWDPGSFFFLTFFFFFFFKSTLMLVSFEKECTNHFQNQTNLLVSVFLQHIFFSSRWILSLFSFLLFFSLSFYPCLPLFLCPYLSLFVSIQHIYYVNSLFQTMESILDILIIFDVKNKILSIECIFNLYNNDMKSVLLLVPLKNETEFESIV